MAESDVTLEEVIAGKAAENFKYFPILSFLSRQANRRSHYLRPALPVAITSPWGVETAQYIAEDSIVTFIGEKFEVEPAEILGKNQKRKITNARQLAMYEIRRLRNHSYPEIGRAFGRDHTTVINGVRRVERLLARGEIDERSKSVHDEIMTWVDSDQQPNTTEPSLVLVVKEGLYVARTIIPKVRELELFGLETPRRSVDWDTADKGPEVYRQWGSVALELLEQTATPDNRPSST